MYTIKNIQSPSAIINFCIKNIDVFVAHSGTLTHSYAVRERRVIFYALAIIIWKKHHFASALVKKY